MGGKRGRTGAWRGGACAILASLAWAATALGQSTTGKVKPTDPPPPVTYRGLVPGLTTAADVRKIMGTPIHEASWYDWKMLYPAEGRPGLIDQIHLDGGKDTHLSCIEASSIPKGLETKDEILARLGKPEFELNMATYSLLDYSALGLRFVVDAAGKTIGVAYIPHLRPRVHPGARRHVDLSKLRQGPQPRPENPAPLNGLKAGGAEATITPTPSMIDPRYQQAYKPHDDLWARVCVFEQGDQTIALVGVDLFGLSLTEVEPIREAVAKDGVEHVIIGCSHNHAAPDTMGVYGHFPAEYVAEMQQKVADCIRAAAKNLRPVKELRAASRELPMDGARVIGLFRNARNPGIVDSTISILVPIGEDGRPIATVVNFACHVEGIEAGVKELTADFPGYMCDQLQRDGMGQPVFLNGAVGGMVSGDNKSRTHEEAKVMGLALAKIVGGLAQTAQPPATFAFTIDRRPAQIPCTNQAFKPLLAARGRLYRGRIKTEMTLATIGECQILSLPGEVLPEIAFEILEKMTGFPRMLVGLGNDQLGYIIPPYDFRDESYEETMSAGPAAGPVVLDTALRMLADAKND